MQERYEQDGKQLHIRRFNATLPSDTKALESTQEAMKEATIVMLPYVSNVL